MILILKVNQSQNISLFADKLNFSKKKKKVNQGLIDLYIKRKVLNQVQDFSFHNRPKQLTQKMLVLENAKHGAQIFAH